MKESVRCQLLHLRGPRIRLILLCLLFAQEIYESSTMSKYAYTLLIVKADPIIVCLRPECLPGSTEFCCRIWLQTIITAKSTRET